MIPAPGDIAAVYTDSSGGNTIRRRVIAFTSNGEPLVVRNDGFLVDARLFIPHHGYAFVFVVDLEDA